MSCQDAVGEALVVAKIEISLSAVVEHINFAMLERVHRSRIDIEIRIELLENDAQTSRFQ